MGHLVILNLGVNDVAYGGAHDASDGAKTTHDVAMILEEQYHPIEVFYELYKEKIAGWMADSVSQSIREIALGKPVGAAPYADAMGKVEMAFRMYLDADEWSRTAPITQQIMAAKVGVSHRKKMPYSSDNDPRPAFIDTGLYQQNFRAWIDP